MIIPHDGEWGGIKGYGGFTPTAGTPEQHAAELRQYRGEVLTEAQGLEGAAAPSATAGAADEGGTITVTGAGVTTTTTTTVRFLNTKDLLRLPSFACLFVSTTCCSETPRLVLCYGYTLRQTSGRKYVLAVSSVANVHPLHL